MSDDKTKTGRADRSRISLTEDYEVRDWCRKFGVTPEQLTAAVEHVGHEAVDVQEYLRATHPEAH